MTCVVGVEVSGGVVMGADSAGVAGWDLTVRADEKVFRKGPFLMGFTSSFRMGQLLRYRLTPPEHPDGMGDFEYMATNFVDAVRSALADGGWRKKEHEREEGGTFLVGYRGRVYTVEDDFQVGASVDGYDACGCGRAIARGALYVLARSKLDGTQRVTMALAAAEASSAGVRAPFKILDSRTAP